LQEPFTTEDTEDTENYRVILRSIRDEGSAFEFFETAEDAKDAEENQKSSIRDNPPSSAKSTIKLFPLSVFYSDVQRLSIETSDRSLRSG
jgi:hypothetical protein